MGHSGLAGGTSSINKNGRELAIMAVALSHRHRFGLKSFVFSTVKECETEKEKEDEVSKKKAAKKATKEPPSEPTTSRGNVNHLKRLREYEGMNRAHIPCTQLTLCFRTDAFRR